MNNIQRALLRTAAATAIVGVCAPAIAANFDANIRIDNTYLANREVNGVTTLKRGLEQSGRLEFNASGKVGEDTFVAGRATILANRDSTLGVDDMWFQLGNKTFDVKLGRFEAFNLLPTPGDVLLIHANTVYQGGILRGRDGASQNYGQGQFHAAATFKPTNNLAFELGIVEFKQTEQITPAPTPAQTDYPDNAKGFRPVVSFNTGALTVAAGAEIVKYGNGNSEIGLGTVITYDFDFMTLNGCVELGKDSSAAAGVSANKQTTFAVTGSSKIGLAGGVFLAKNQQGTGIEDGKVTTLYASYTHSLFDIKGASWSLGASTSTVGGSYKNTTSDEKGLRLRFDYTF